jgi:hypothetical protein
MFGQMYQLNHYSLSVHRGPERMAQSVKEETLCPMRQALCFITPYPALFVQSSVINRQS